MSKSSFAAVCFKNDMGQCIVPGDRVLVVTVSTRRVRTYIGIYQGIVNGYEDGTGGSYRIHYFPGFRMVKVGETVHKYFDFVNGSERSFTMPSYERVEDDKFYKIRTSYLGRIYKLN